MHKYSQIERTQVLLAGCISGSTLGDLNPADKENLQGVTVIPRKRFQFRVFFGAICLKRGLFGVMALLPDVQTVPVVQALGAKRRALSNSR